MHQADATDVVQRLLDEFIADYRVDVVEINRGLCLDFARGIIERLGEGAKIESSTDFDLHDWHCWVRFNGLCYDAEHPGGVAHPASLLFNR